MKRFLIVIVALSLACNLHADIECDVILTSNNFQIPCIITKISDKEIQYGKCPATVDSIFTISVSNVKIVYMYDGLVLNYANGNIPVLSDNIGRVFVYSPHPKQEDTTSQKENTEINTVETIDLDTLSENGEEEQITQPTEIDSLEIHKKSSDTILVITKDAEAENNEEIITENIFVESSYELTSREIKQKALACVHRYAGLYIFNDNEPLCDYMVLGRVKAGVTWSSQYEGVRNALVKKALKQYPQADAVIINLTDGGIDIATAIKFSDSNEKGKWGYAKVNSFNGLYIFSDCEPINNYTIIGRSKSVITWSGQYDAVKANLVKRALKKIPNGQGIILNLHQGGVDRGVIITF